jgi:hypothetical protein
MKLSEINKETSSEKFKRDYNFFKEFFEKNFERSVENEKLTVFFDEPNDDCMDIEWIFKDFRYGFIIEKDHDKSSFYFVSNEKYGELSASALLNDPVCSELIKIINKKVF